MYVPPAFREDDLAALHGTMRDLRLPVTRLEGKRKMSQNRNAEDRAGVAAGLAASGQAADRAAAALTPG
jgi:transcriptional regulator